MHPHTKQNGGTLRNKQTNLPEPHAMQTLDKLVVIEKVNVNKRIEPIEPRQVEFLPMKSRKRRIFQTRSRSSRFELETATQKTTAAGTRTISTYPTNAAKRDLPIACFTFPRRRALRIPSSRLAPTECLDPSRPASPSSSDLICNCICACRSSWSPAASHARMRSNLRFFILSFFEADDGSAAALGVVVEAIVVGVKLSRRFSSSLFRIRFTAAAVVVESTWWHCSP